MVLATAVVDVAGLTAESNSRTAGCAHAGHCGLATRLSGWPFVVSGVHVMWLHCAYTHICLGFQTKPLRPAHPSEPAVVMAMHPLGASGVFFYFSGD